MTKEDAISTIHLFVEKADRLARSEFVKSAIAGTGVKFSSGVGKATTVERRGPTEENIDAFVLTFRFFIQDNERISLRNFSAIFGSSFALPQETADFDNLRSEVNAFLDSPTMFKVEGVINRRDLMEVFIYGGLSHANPQKKERYDAWMEHGVLGPFMENEFVAVLIVVLNAIEYIKVKSENILERIKA